MNKKNNCIVFINIKCKKTLLCGLFKKISIDCLKENMFYKYKASSCNILFDKIICIVIYKSGIFFSKIYVKSM